MATSKHGSIVKRLRQQIVSGTIEPGSRLPTRAKLVQDFDVSPLTMQRAFDELIHDGFVETRGKAGTFVSLQSPHLTHYAMVFHGDVTTSRYYQALASEQIELEHSGRRVSSYFNVNGDDDSPDTQRLLDDIYAHRIAGIVFSTHPYPLNGSPIITEPGIPRCAFMTAKAYPHITAVYGDYNSFFRRAVKFLAERGRHKVAWLHNGHSPACKTYRLDEAMVAHSMISRRSWTQFPSYLSKEATQHAVLGMLDVPPEYRPDSLVITDDNLVEAATQGIAMTGVIPDNLDVIAMSNYPNPPSSSFPITRLGFDLGAQLKQCFANIDAERQGETAPDVTMFGAVFEHELPSSQLEIAT